MSTVFNKASLAIFLLYSSNAMCAVVDDFEDGSGLRILLIEDALKAMVYAMVLIFGGWIVVSKLRSFADDKTSAGELAGVMARAIFFSLLVILIIV